MIGREPERAVLAEFLGASAPWPALLLTGGPGIGKTVLWEEGLSLAREQGIRVLAARPCGAEAELSFAGVERHARQALAWARNAWAVGGVTTDNESMRTMLILHWNGRAWKRVAGPGAGPVNVLIGVAASSAGNVWAVGSFDTGNVRQALAFHCC